jgi:hypothetical protein
MHFTRPAIVLKQPLLVFTTIAFTVGVVLAAFWPDGEVVETEPLGWGAWLFWFLMLALLALGVWMLCHAEEIFIDEARQRVTQTHRFLNHKVKQNHWRFADFTAVAVTLKIDKEEQGSSMPTGGATLTTARTVYTRRYELGLRRPDQVLTTAEGTLTAPRPALDLPLAADGDALAVESVGRTLAALGGWPALRHHYTLRPLPGAEPPCTVKVVVGGEEPLT